MPPHLEDDERVKQDDVHDPRHRLGVPKVDDQVDERRDEGRPGVRDPERPQRRHGAARPGKADDAQREQD